MKDLLRRQYDNWKSHRRDAAFQRGIRSYNREVLQPRALQFGADAELIHEKKNRRIYADQNRVWKFYHRSQRRYPREFAAAAAALLHAGIPCPRIHYLDARGDSAKKIYPSLILMDRIHGRMLEPGDFANESVLRLLGRTLAQIHNIRREHWGEIEESRKHSTGETFAEHFSRDFLAHDLKWIDQWIESSKEPPLAGIDRWFTTERMRAAEPPSGRYCLVLGDPNPGNFFLLPDGRLSVIDLDLAAYADFPMDLAHVLTGMVTFVMPDDATSLSECIRILEAEREPFLESYFETIPEHRVHWKQVRELYMLRRILQIAAILIKGMKPEYNDYLGRDPKTVDDLIRRNLGAVRQWLRQE